MASKDHNAIVEISEIDMPDTTISAKEAFDLDIDMEMPAFSQKTEYVPDLDETYCFDHDTTLAIMVAFAHNRRLLIQGYHGTGKSTHVEQDAARLN
ncbi:MAG: cobaltochelatase subunit CobS, partial [Pseudomonadota bacterium]|nr:cobaltochelatase subunit CobS [Pseudomonadota bacterium]